MKALRYVFCLSLIAALPLAQVQAKEPATLRYEMTPGDRLVYRRTAEYTETMTANEVPAGAGKSGEMMEVVVWTLERVDDAGSFHIRRENKQLRLKIQAGALEFGYDSTKPKSAQEKGGKLTELFVRLSEALSGSTMTFVMTPRGEIKETKGPAAEILKKMPRFAGDVANVLSGAETEGGETPQSQVMQGLLVLPEEAVEPGDTWSTVQDFENSANGLVKRVFQYDGSGIVDGRPAARIDIRYEQKSELEMGELFGKVTFSTDSSSGTAQFAPDAGQLVSLDASHTVSGTAAFDLAGQKAPMKIEKSKKITIELLDDVPE